MLTDSIKEDRIVEHDIKDKVDESDHQPTTDKWELDKAEMRRNKFKLPPLVMSKKSCKPGEG